MFKMLEVASRPTRRPPTDPADHPLTPPIFASSRPFFTSNFGPRFWWILNGFWPPIWLRFGPKFMLFTACFRTLILQRFVIEVSLISCTHDNVKKQFQRGTLRKKQDIACSGIPYICPWFYPYFWHHFGNVLVEIDTSFRPWVLLWFVIDFLSTLSTASLQKVEALDIPNPYFSFFFRNIDLGMHSGYYLATIWLPSDTPLAFVGLVWVLWTSMLAVLAIILGDFITPLRVDA